MKKRTIALATAAVLAGGGTTAVATGSAANADGPERHARGTVGGASYEIDAEKERGWFDVDADLEGVPAGSTWRLVVRHEGRRIAVRTVHSEPDDGGWEVDFPEVHSRNTAGRDTFKVKIVRVGSSAKVVRTLTFRR